MSFDKYYSHKLFFIVDNDQIQKMLQMIIIHYLQHEIQEICMIAYQIKSNIIIIHSL